MDRPYITKWVMNDTGRGGDFRQPILVLTRHPARVVRKADRGSAQVIGS